MRFDPFSWQEVNANEQVQGPKGRLRVMCSSPEGAVFIEAEGYEVLAPGGREIDVTLTGDYLFRCDGPGRFFVYQPSKQLLRPSGVVYSNIDLKPTLSGTYGEIQRGMRQLELARRQAMAEIAEASRAMGVRGADAVSAKAGKAEPQAEVDEEPEGSSDEAAE